MNHAIFAGRLGRDAETKQTNNSSVTNFSVAVDVGWGDTKRTLWVSAAMWGERGEKVAQYLTKGTAVTVAGDVDLRQFDKKDGTPGAEITLNVQRLTLQGRGSEKEPSSAQEHRESPSRASTATAAASGSSASVAKDADFDDDIPF